MYVFVVIPISIQRQPLFDPIKFLYSLSFDVARWREIILHNVSDCSVSRRGAAKNTDRNQEPTVDSFILGKFSEII